MAVIDNLSISIKASADDANKAIDSLVKKLNTLSSSLGSIDTKGLQKFSSGVAILGSGMKSLENVKLPDYTRLAKGIQKFNDIDGAKLSAISSGLRPLADSVRLFSNVKFDNKNLTAFINSITRLSNSNLSGLTSADFGNFQNQLVGLTNALSRAGEISKQTTNLVNGIAKLANAGSNATIAAQSLPLLRTELEQLISSLSRAGTVSQETISLTTAIASLANAGQKAGATAGNLGVLATELRNLFTVLSTAPNVSQNIIDMTNALANLASQGSRVGSSSRSIVRGMNNTSNAMRRTTRSSTSLAAAFGKFYATWFLVIRGAKQLINAIEGTADYIEAYNYYNVALGKIASDWSGDWEKYGYENAEAYAESFTERLDASLNKLSGLEVTMDAEVEGTGLLTESGMKNLGLNIQEITQYASQLASVTNSVGQTGEVSIAAASAFTKLAGDISSLFNIDYSSAAQNIQSGLIGQSRALYKYGIDITNATLQTYAYNLGLEKAVSEMTQAEKMQLRMIAILDQSKVAWSDLSNTISSPSNQLRQFTNNVKEAGMVFGQLFIPVLQKVLPVLNGVVIAIKRLLVSIAQLLGVKIDFNQFGQGYSDASDDIDEMSDSLDGVAKAAKKAKAGLRGFDELQVINMPEENGGTSGAGAGTIDLTADILKATAEYEKAWQEAYDRMENKAQEIADNISKYLEPVRKIFEDFTIGDYFQAGQDVSHLVSGIFNFFAEAIDRVDWYGIGKRMGDFLAGIDWISILKSVGNLIWQALKAAFELYVGMFDAAPLETSVISLVAMPKLLKAITSSKIITGLKKLFSNFKLVATALAGNQDSLKILNKSYPKLGKAVDVARKAFANFRFGIENGNFLTGLNEGISTIRNNLTGFQKGIIGVVSVVGEFALLKDAFYDIASGADNLVASIAQIAVGAGAASAALYVAFGPAGLVIAGITGVVAAISGIKSAMEDLVDENIGNSIRDALIVPGGVPIESIAEKFKNVVAEVGDSFSKINEKSSNMEATKENIIDVWSEIEQIKLQMDAGVISVEEGTQELTRLFGELESVVKDHFGGINETLIAAFGENGAFRKYAENIGEDISDELLAAIGVTGEMEDRASELIELLSNPNISEEDYVSYRSELNNLLGVTDELSAALSEFESQMSNIDTDYSYDIFVNMNTGELQTDKIDEFNNSIVTSIKNADTQIEQAGKNIMDILDDMMEQADTLSERNAIQILMDTVNGSMESAKADIRQRATEITDVMQYDFVDKFTGIIEQAEKDWENMSPMDRFWLGQTKDEYIKSYVDAQIENLNYLSSSIESSMNQLGIDGAGWGKDAGEKVIESIFDASINRSAGKTPYLSYELNSDYESILQDLKDEISPVSYSTGQSIGENIGEGAKEGIKSTTQSVISAAQGIVNGVKGVLVSELEIHSPSKVMFELGDYTMQGFQLGMESLYKTIFTSLKQFGNNVQLAAAPDTRDLYQSYGYTYASASLPNYEQVYGYNTGNTQSNAETNALLRRQNELLEQILSKPTLSNNDVFNAAKTVYKGEAIRRYGNSAAFDPVWG